MTPSPLAIDLWRLNLTDSPSEPTHADLEAAAALAYVVRQMRRDKEISARALESLSPSQPQITTLGDWARLLDRDGQEMSVRRCGEVRP